jgi:hypothetical protein
MFTYWLNAHLSARSGAFLKGAGGAVVAVGVARRGVAWGWWWEGGEREGEERRKKEGRKKEKRKEAQKQEM